MTHPMHPTSRTTRRDVLRGTVAAATLGATTAAPAGEAQAAPAGAAPADAKGRSGLSIGILLFNGYGILDPTGPVRTDTGDVALVAERFLAVAGRLDVLRVSGGGNRGMAVSSRSGTYAPAARAIQPALEYDPQPPFDSGNAAEANDELKRRTLELLSASEV